MRGYCQIAKRFSASSSGDEPVRYCYHGEPKRGIYHYDTIVFPHICTALVKGQWNIAEYTIELSPLLKEYNIDDSKLYSIYS